MSKPAWLLLGVGLLLAGCTDSATWTRQQKLDFLASCQNSRASCDCQVQAFEDKGLRAERFSATPTRHEQRIIVEVVQECVPAPKS